MKVEQNSLSGSNVVKFPSNNGGDGGGTIDGMEERVAKLEALATKVDERLHAIDIKVGKIETRLDYSATKGDVAEAKSSIIIWVVSAVFLAQILPQLPKIIDALKALGAPHP